jgi:hypothetical protein
MDASTEGGADDAGAQAQLSAATLPALPPPAA